MRLRATQKKNKKNLKKNKIKTKKKMHDKKVYI